MLLVCAIIVVSMTTAAAVSTVSELGIDRQLIDAKPCFWPLTCVAMCRAGVFYTREFQLTTCRTVSMMRPCGLIFKATFKMKNIW